jgi:hypothetical protein
MPWLICVSLSSYASTLKVYYGYDSLMGGHLSLVPQTTLPVSNFPFRNLYGPLSQVFDFGDKISTFGDKFNCAFLGSNLGTFSSLFFWGQTCLFLGTN